MHAQLIFICRLVPPTMSLPLCIAVVVSITFVLLINAWWDRHWKLRNLPTPVCFSFSFLWPLLSFSNVFKPRSKPRLQAGASLVWGHEKFEFEDDQAFQWRAWFNECGRAFKIKAAWGHPEIVRGLAPTFHLRTAPIYTDCDHSIHLYSW